MDETTFNRRRQLFIESKQRSIERIRNERSAKAYNSEWKSYVDIVRYKLIANEPRINFHNTLNHELAKAKLCYLFKKTNRLCYCEVIFKENIGGRCDILVPHEDTIIEILESETDEQVNLKAGYYPKEYTIVPLKASKILRDDFILWD